MRIIKCDLCRKVIKGEPITAGLGAFPSAEFCEDCGKPIWDLLSKNKLIDDFSLEKFKKSKLKIKK